MQVCEYIKELLCGCSALDGEVIATGFFDEKLGGAAVLPDGGEKILRRYTDGGCLAETGARIVFAHSGGMGEKAERQSCDRAEQICGQINELSKQSRLPNFGLYTVSEVYCTQGSVGGNVGVRRRELECRVRYIKGKD